MSKFKAYYCQQERTTQLSDRMYKRNLADGSLAPHIFARSVSTRLETMPMMDCRKVAPTLLASYPTYQNNQTFHPGSSAPYSGYCNNVDIETHLRNTIHPLQKAAQSKYIPDSSSDLFNIKHFNQTMGVNPNDLLQKQEQFAPFNPNKCHLGGQLFDNHTRQQTKEVSLKDDGKIDVENKEK